MKQHPSLDGCWDSLNKDQVLSQCQNCFGEDIGKLIHHEWEQIESNEASMEFVGSGEWLDKMDMDAKYKDKPQRLAAIYKNTKTWTCPIGEVTLFEDMTYKSKESSKTSMKRSLTSTNSTSQKCAPKKVKVVKEESAGAREGFGIHHHPHHPPPPPHHIT